MLLAWYRSLKQHFNPRTPAKECDMITVAVACLAKNFNPRTPAKECDKMLWWPGKAQLLFQSTHPREGVRLTSII